MEGSNLFENVQVLVPIESVPEVTYEEASERKGLLTYHVVFKGEHWEVKRQGDNQPYAISENKENAINIGREYCIREKAELKIHNMDGTIGESNSYGNDPLGNG